jgi:hypothetical protein
MTPVGDMSLPGPLFTLTYFGEALRKLGVGIDVIRSGKFKSAFEPFVADEPSPATIEMYESMEASMRKHYIDVIAKGRLGDDQAKRDSPAYLADFQSLNKLIDAGYKRLDEQIAAGGESPIYPRIDPRFRTSDAALLNIIYPAALQRLTLEQKEKILRAVDPLIGEIGIRRYLKDPFQTANFWVQAPRTQPNRSAGKDKTSRRRRIHNSTPSELEFIENSEAQWFFDSWYSQVMAQMYRETHLQKYFDDQRKFFNRALAQITPSKAEGLMIGADGNQVSGMALPGSYNRIVDRDRKYFAPSPIVPFTWAKASLLLSLQSMEDSLGIPVTP